MKRIEIINGPNLNLVGRREPGIYGVENMDDYIKRLKERYKEIEIGYYQSNVEGEIVDRIQEVGFSADGIIINAGGYSHTSVAIRDAIAAVSAVAIEVHISNIYAREEFRHNSMLSAVCRGTITGLGLEGYALATEYLAGATSC
jgi:3-dehydroquinate dehydratase-2